MYDGLKVAARAIIRFNKLSNDLGLGFNKVNFSRVAKLVSRYSQNY